MARFNIRYLVVQPGPNGGLPRYFWQPSSKLRAEGWRPQRLPLDWGRYTDAGALQAAAIERAQELNTEMDATRETKALSAVRPAPPPAQRTFGQLITAYKQSDGWLDLAPRTQVNYLQCIAKIETWAADVPVRAIDSERVQKLIRSLRKTPSYANAVARVLRLLLEYGRRNSWIVVNPAMRPGLTNSEPGGIIWPAEAVRLFVATADAMGRHSIGTAVLANEWLGQREGDVLALSRQALRNGTLLVRQSKRGAGVALPVDDVRHVAERFAEEAARQRTRAGEDKPLPLTLIVNEGTGLPYKIDTFRHRFAEVRAKAAEAAPNGFEIDYLMPGRDSNAPGAFVIRMEDLTFMRLRHTAVTRLAEAECDDTLISSVTGHSLASVKQILQRYMVRTSKMARIAFGKRVTAEGLATVAEKGQADAG